MNKVIREVQLELSLVLLNALIADEQPFRLVIHQNDDWDYPLPEAVVLENPNHLIMNITAEVFEHIFYEDSESKEPTLKMMFPTPDGDAAEFHKTIRPEDIVAIVNLADNQPLMLNNFNLTKALTREEQGILEETMNETYFKPRTKDEWIQNTVEDGISEEDAQRSIEAFMKNNPDILVRR